MAYSPDGLFGGRYLDPSMYPYGGRGGALLTAARRQTAEGLGEHWAELDGSDPAWTQKVINDELNPADQTWLDAYTRFLSPTAWAEFYLGLGISAGQAVDNVTHGAASSGLSALATLLESAAAPAANYLNELIATYKPGLDGVLAAMSESISHQQVSLQAARESLSTVNEFLTTIAQAGDEGGALDAFIAEARGRVAAWRVTPESLGIPDWVPEATYGWMLARFNGVLDTILSGVDWLSSQARPGVDSFVDTQTAAAQVRIAQIQQVIAEGGEAELLLQSSYDTFASGVAAFTEMVAAWDPSITLDFQGAVAYLRQESDRQSQAAFESRLETFREYLRTTAQGQVDGWRADHGDAVEGAYHPAVPAHEIAALQEANQLITATLDDRIAQSPDWAPYAEDYRARAADAYGAAMAASSGRGQAALDTFWVNADRLAEVSAVIGA